MGSIYQGMHRGGRREKRMCGNLHHIQIAHIEFHLDANRYGIDQLTYRESAGYLTAE